MLKHQYFGSSWQKRAKSDNRNRILSELAKNDLTFGELEEKTGLSRPVLSNYLKQNTRSSMIDDASIEHRPRTKGKFAVYTITEKGIQEISNVGQSVSEILGVLHKMAEDYPAAKGILELENLAKEKPKLFLDLFRWTLDLFAISSSEANMKWISKHGIEKLQPALQRELKKKGQKKVVETDDELVNALNQTLASLGEIITHTE